MVAAGSGLALCVLGSPVACWQGEPLALPTRKSLALLCYVALRRRPAARSELAELLWGAGQHQNLRWELHQLRKLPGAACWLHIGEKIAVAAESDLAAFEAALAAGKFAEALRYYRGEPDKQLFAGLELKGAPAFFDWLELERTRLEALLRDALRGHAEALERCGDMAGALEHYRELLAHDPLDESAHRAVMRLELARGDLVAALRQFECCRRVLAEELGVAPLPETLALAGELERAALTPSPASLRLRRPIPPKLLRPPLLVGREREWAALEAAWEKRQLTFIAGAAGVGKSRLMLDFVRAKVGDNYAVLHGRPGDKQVPFSTIARGFRIVFEQHPQLKAALPPWVGRELARFLPDVFSDVSDIPPVTSDADKARLTEAFYHFMRALFSYFAAYVVDDMHFFDTGTLIEGGKVIPRIYATAQLLGVGWQVYAFRESEMRPQNLKGFKAMASAGLATYLDLGPLGPAALGEMLASLDVALSPPAAHALYQRTGGNPLFVIELLRALFEEGDPERDLQALATAPPPERISLIIGERLERLHDHERLLLQALAILGQDASLEALAAVLAQDIPRLARTLAELERSQMISGLAFSHDLLFEGVVKTTPASVRSYLHRRTAQALEALGGNPARIAHHWEAAGEFAKALPWRLSAALAAQAQGLVEQAQAWLAEVLERAEPESALHAEATRVWAAWQRGGTS